MSIWGPQPAENDDAADWLADFVDDPSIAAINEALDAVLVTDEDAYWEITECAEAFVAAALIVDILSTTHSELVPDEEIKQKLRDDLSKLDRTAAISLLKRAVTALRHIGSDEERSELFQLWHEEENDSSEWDEIVATLLKQLENYLERMS
jgi:G3E family GTPase